MNRLSMPEHITLTWELFPGVGRAELLKILAVGLPGLLLGFLLSNSVEDPMQALWWMIGGVGWCLAAYAIFARFGGASVQQILFRWRRYYKEQEKFFYRKEETIEIVSQKNR